VDANFGGVLLEVGVLDSIVGDVVRLLLARRLEVGAVLDLSRLEAVLARAHVHVNLRTRTHETNQSTIKCMQPGFRVDSSIRGSSGVGSSSRQQAAGSRRREQQQQQQEQEEEEEEEEEEES